MKILEQNGIDIENVDGAAFNNVCMNGKSGILPGVLGQCTMSAASSNVLSVGSGELIISGFRVKLTESTVFTFSVSPESDVQYYLIATIRVSASHEVSFEFTYSTDPTVVQDSIFETEQGIYQVQFGKFMHRSDGTIDSVERLLSVLDDLNNLSVLKIGNTTVTEQQIISLLNLLN